MSVAKFQTGFPKENHVRERGFPKEKMTSSLSTARLLYHIPEQLSRIVAKFLDTTKPQTLSGFENATERSGLVYRIYGGGLTNRNNNL